MTMGRLRWLLGSSMCFTFVYMLYMLNKLDTSVSNLISEKKILLRDNVQSKKHLSSNLPSETTKASLLQTLSPFQQHKSTSTGVPKSKRQHTTIVGTSKAAYWSREANKNLYSLLQKTTTSSVVLQTKAVMPQTRVTRSTSGQDLISTTNKVTATYIFFTSSSLPLRWPAADKKNELDNSSLRPSQSLSYTNWVTAQLNRKFDTTHKNDPEHPATLGGNLTVSYAVDTPSCKIPLLDPFDRSMADLLLKLPPLKCQGTQLPRLLISRGNNIYVDDDARRHYGSNVSCYYQSINRVDDNHALLANRTVPIQGETAVFAEFVKATCRNISSVGSPVVYTDYFPFIVKKPSVENRYRATKIDSSARQAEQLSIILLGLDSTSRNQFVRHFPKTLAFLRNNVTSVDLQGYNKVGSNTYPNMMPLLTGRLATELPNIELVYADILPLIWKNYTRSGYLSQYGEDVPSVTLFNYGKKGFKEVPADYYLRPYSKMVEGTPFDLTKWGCLGLRLETAVILKWTEDFFDTFPQDPLFSFIFFTRLSHENFTTLSYSDQPVLEFLQHMQVKGHLNRSMVFMFGDHGFRFGTVRNRYVGRLEEKLPAMFITIPSWFPQKYPKLYRNMKVNEHKLTTPFDVFETLKDILHFSGKEKHFDQKSRGISLLTSIPSSRTCQDAAINAQWCSCTDWKRADVKNNYVTRSVALLIERINSITLPKRDVCLEVTLDSVISAQEHSVSMGEEWSKDNSTHYQVVFRVKPSGGVFEGTVWHNDALKTVSVDGIVDRLNLYGNQSACVHDASLKPFCFCHQL